MKKTSRLLSLLLAVVMLICVLAAAPVSASAASVITGLSTGTVYSNTYTYSDYSWEQSFKVSSKGKLTINFERPYDSDYDYLPETYLSLYDGSGELITIKNYPAAMAENTSRSVSVIAYLAADDFKIEVTSFLEDVEVSADASYKLSYSTAKPKAPKISQKKSKPGNLYRADITFKNNDYSGCQAFLKKDNGKWEKKCDDYIPESAIDVPYVFTYSNAAYFYFYRFRAYVTLSDGTRWYSDYSNTLYTQTGLKPSKTIVTVKSTKKKQVKVKWAKVSQASGYDVYRSTKKNKGFKKVKTTKKNSFTNKKLKRGTTYYYKIKTYRTIKGVKVYSRFSKVKKVKCK